MMTKPTQISEKSAKVHQNTLSFAGLRSFSLTLHSNFHVYSPCSSKSTHHLKPTKILPLIFLTIQKSTAAAMTTNCNADVYCVKRGMTR